MLRKVTNNVAAVAILSVVLGCLLAVVLDSSAAPSNNSVVMQHTAVNPMPTRDPRMMLSAPLTSADRADLEAAAKKVEESAENNQTVPKHPSTSTPIAATSRSPSESSISSTPQAQQQQTLPTSTLWSCHEYPQRCAFLLQCFVMPSTGKEYAAKVDESLAENALPEAMWYPYRTAKQLRTIYGPDAAIILATNWPLDFVQQLWKNATLLMTNGASDQLPFTEIVSTVRTIKEFRAGKGMSFQYLLKADAMKFVDPTKYPRAMYLDTDVDISDVSAEDMLAEAMVGNVSGVTADFGMSKAVPRMSEEVVQWFRTRSKTKKNEKQKGRHNRLLYDAFDTLAHYDMALVPEFSGFRDLSAILYSSLLEDDSPPYHSHQYWNVHMAYHLSIHELQFNTGLVAFRNNDCVGREFMNSWSHIHRKVKRCLQDTVAWDQCSMPRALRASRIRVAPLPSVFNFREALGRGCSPLVYGPNGEYLGGEAKWRGRPDAKLNETAKHVVVNHNQIKRALVVDLLTTLLPTPELQSMISCRSYDAKKQRVPCESRLFKKKEERSSATTKKT